MCTDDEHSDREPEHHRHVGIVLQSRVGGRREENKRHVIRQRVRSVRVSFLEHQQAAVVYAACVHLFDTDHDHQPLHSRHSPAEVQNCKKRFPLVSVL